MRVKSGQEGGVPDDKEETEEEVGEHGEEEGQGQVVSVRGRRLEHPLVGVTTVEGHCLLHPTLQHNALNYVTPTVRAIR